MRNAYAILGLTFIIVFGTAYILYDRAHAPTFEPAPQVVDVSTELILSSTVFENNGLIPSRYTCDGDNISPPLSINGVPEGTESLVLVMDDSDLPEEVKVSRGIEKFDHWAVYGIPADTTELPEGFTGGGQGINSRGETGYAGPCPPPEYEPAEHRYQFRVYALPSSLNFIQAPTLDELETAAKGSALGVATLTGRYSRIKE